MAFFGCFLPERDFVAMFWSIFLVVKAKQDKSSCCFPFNLLCEWFFDRFHQKIEVIGQIRWEWKLHCGLGARSGAHWIKLYKPRPRSRNLGSSLEIDNTFWSFWGSQLCRWNVRTSCPIKMWNWPDIFKIWSDNVRCPTVISSSALMWRRDAVSEFICDALMWQRDAVSEFIWASTWLCSRAMRIQSIPTIWPLLTTESPVAQW